MTHTIVLPQIMQIGENALADLPSVLQHFNASRPMIITDKVMVSLGNIEKAQQLLSDAGINSIIFADTIPEPDDVSLQAGIDMLNANEVDSIIAIGGGSVIDSAKAISIVGKYGGVIRDYKVPRRVDEQGLPLIAVPTTAGTGSEVTQFTVITDKASSEKMLCAGKGFMPQATLLDFSLTLSCPARVTADSGLDALVHAIESYVSRKQNQFSDQQALSAMRLIANNILTAYNEPNDKAARQAMLLGANLAGLAFSNASVALVHGMSRPIGAFFHVPHGLSNAMLLPSIVEYSLPSAPQRYADCAVAIGVALPSDSIETAHKNLLMRLNEFNEQMSVPTLAEFGVDKAEFDKVIETMAAQAEASGSPSNNPRIPTQAEMIELYQGLWN